MYLSALILTAILSVATAGRSPYADLVDKLQNSPDGARYSTDVFEDGRLDLEGLIRKYRYPYEDHQVVTEDGYILTAQRIPHGRDRNNQPGQKPVVLLMHGLFSSAADFVVLGPGSALSYILAEEGYDVWLLNARGSFHSRNHTTLDPNWGRDTDFWKFSWDEIGNYDLPAYIDYILETTGQTKVHYIGHSQGGTTFLVLTSLRPEYNEKIISFQALAPGAYFFNNKRPVFVLLSSYESILEGLANQIGIYEVLPRSELLSPLLMYACRDGMSTQQLCLSFVENDNNAGSYNTTMFPAIVGHAPSGAALRQVIHYAQSIKYDTFSRYSYGYIGNLRVYGRLTPPPYDMNRVTAKTYLYYGLNDESADYRDILYLEEVLPNAKAIQVPRAGFNHYDFIWGSDARELLFETVLQMMREAENL